MRRTQIILDEPTYQNLRRQAYEKGWSISRLVRDLLARAFMPPESLPKGNTKRFTFVGAGRSNQEAVAPVSERHDEALAETFSGKRRR